MVAEAVYTCNNGLLAARPVTAEQLQIDLQRLVLDAVDPLEKRVKA